MDTHRDLEREPDRRAESGAAPGNLRRRRSEVERLRAHDGSRSCALFCFTVNPAAAKDDKVTTPPTAGFPRASRGTLNATEI